MKTPKITYRASKHPPFKIECAIDFVGGFSVCAKAEEVRTNDGDTIVTFNTGSPANLVYPIDFRAYVIGIYGIGVVGFELAKANINGMKTQLRRKVIADALKRVRDHTKQLLASEKILIMCKIPNHENKSANP